MTHAAAPGPGEGGARPPAAFADDGLVVVRPDGAILAAGGCFADAVDRDAAGAAGASLFALLHPDDHRSVRAALDGLADVGGTSGPVVVRLAAAAGWRPATATVTSLAGRPPLDDAVVVAVKAARRALAGAGGPGRPGGHPLAVDLGHALDRGQLRVVCQPKVSLATGRIVGAEALLRWDHPRLGPVPAAEFIPVAEATGLIEPIGAWVLGEACRQGAAWHRASPRSRPVVVHVNVSAEQFRMALADAVRSAVAASGVDPRGVGLEVTESTVMEDVGAAIAVLGELKGLGLSLSMDDFGTGYSSLEYLRRLPLDEVKIDRSFVAGLGTDPEDTAIVAAVVSLAHALGRDVVAEGVETHRQLEKLRALGCDMAQGFLLAPPLPAGDLTALLRREEGGERLAGLRPGAAAGSDTVVVADDAADVRQLVRMSLTAAGFEVHEATDGAGAIALARRRRPSCVLLDLGLPDMSGVDVCRALRSHPDTADCTIVILTSRDVAADKAASFSAGADDYIVKPFAPRDLVSRVRGAVARRPPAGGRRR